MNIFKSAFFLVALSAIVQGCFTPRYSGGKIVEGTDIAVGFALPVSEGTWQIDILNYLSGYRFSFSEGAEVSCEYSMTNTTSFAGIYESTTVKTFRTDLNPTIDESLDKKEAKAEDGSASDVPEGEIEVAPCAGKPLEP